MGNGQEVDKPVPGAGGRRKKYGTSDNPSVMIYLVWTHNKVKENDL